MQLLETPILRTPRGDIAINKIKVKGDWESIHINFDLPPETTETKVVNFNCKDRPRNELINAFSELMRHVLAIAQLDWETGGIEAIAFKEDDGLMVAFTAFNKIDDYEVTVNIGYFYPQDTLLDKINHALAEIEDYISGKRAQMSLFEMKRVSKICAQKFSSFCPQ